MILPTPAMPWLWVAAMALAAMCFTVDICIRTASDRPARPGAYVPLCPPAPPLTYRQRHEYVGRHHLPVSAEAT